jgi:hypothetical protein
MWQWQKERTCRSGASAARRPHFEAAPQERRQLRLHKVLVRLHTASVPFLASCRMSFCFTRTSQRKAISILQHRAAYTHCQRASHPSRIKCLCTVAFRVYLARSFWKKKRSGEDVRGCCIHARSRHASAFTASSLDIACVLRLNMSW